MPETRVQFMAHWLNIESLQSQIDDTIHESELGIQYSWKAPPARQGTLQTFDPAIVAAFITSSATVLAAVLTIVASTILRESARHSRTDEDSSKVSITISRSRVSRTIVYAKGDEISTTVLEEISSEDGTIKVKFDRA